MKTGPALLFLGGLLLVGHVYNLGPKTSSTTETATPEAPSCKNDDWSKCADNEEMANSNAWYWVSATTACKRAANRVAKYGDPKWPWLPFSHYKSGDSYAKTGIAVLIEPDAQFQNGFGAWAHVKVICTYDLREKKVTNIQADNTR